MRFSGICLHSSQVGRLREFYIQLLGVQPSGNDHWWVDFGNLGGAQLSIFSNEGMEEMAPGSTAGAGTGACTIELEVGDVDAEWERLRGLGVEIVKPPTTQTWGRRSVWVRDPDGNIVNLYCQVAES